MTAQEVPAESSKTAAAEYIAIEMSRLARMASAHDLRLLAYLIDVAVLEAWREASGPEDAPEDGGDGVGGPTAAG
jgi:hypothetical protein